MAKGNAIEAGARAIAEDLRLPGGGQKKLARVVRNHLDWFSAAEDRGFTWADMSRLLFAAGAKGESGNAFSVSTLYVTVRREREREEILGSSAASPTRSITARQSSERELLPQRSRPRTPRGSGSAETPRKPRQVRKVKFEKPERHAEKEEDKHLEASAERRLSTKRAETVLPNSPSKKELLAFMQRSAAIRGFKSDK